MATLPLVATIAQLEAHREAGRFLRWSNSIAKDSERGYSICAGSSRERGISAVLCAPVLARRSSQSDFELWARSVLEYERLTGARYCYVIAGEPVGRGADGEPVLAAVQPIARISPTLLRQMRALRTELGQEWYR